MTVANRVVAGFSCFRMGTSDASREALLARLFGDEGIPSALNDELLRTRDVARAFQVSERTVAEWARRGRIPSVRTPGGHRLYPADKIRDLLRVAESGGSQAATPA
jgi:excisionase family DNA binding protein